MCHLILLIPVLAIPIFWLVPLNLAVPVYLLIISISGVFHWFIVKPMRNPVATGSESIIGSTAKAVSILEPVGHDQYLARTRGEIWSVYCSDA